MRRTLLLVLLLVLTTLIVLPANAAPCPGADCSAVELTAPTAGATLSGTIQLEATAVQLEADRGDIVNMEWWLYHPSFAVQVPENEESKLLLDEASAPSSGDRTDGTWSGTWTVSRTVTARDGAYMLPEPTRTYTLPEDDGQYRIEAHVLDDQWWADNPAPGGPPGRTPAVAVSISFGDEPAPPAPPPADGVVDLGGLTLPTSIALLPDGRVYVGEKGGAIRTAPSLGATSTSWAAAVDTFTNGDHGLQSLAYLDEFLYVAYTGQPQGPCNPDDFGAEGQTGCVVHGQVDRFPVDRATGALGTPQAVRGGPGGWCAQFQTHGIDDIVAGEDGFLYVSAGDGAGYSVADTGQFGGDPCGDGGALRAQSTTNLAGNIARMDPQTGATTTLAYGFRNPYRITFQPGTSNLYVGDVGWYTAEELNLVDTAGAVTNHGWPCREGTGPMSVYADLPACAGVTGTAPIHSYTHDGENAAISAVGWHDGRVYYGDYHRREIRSVTPTGSGDRLERSGPMPVDMVSTDEGLVYVDIGAGTVRSLTFDGGDVTEPPPASPPFAEVVVSEAPWQPGATIDYAVDFRNLGRQPVEVTWTITLDDADTTAEVVHTDTGAPAGPDGRHSGSFTAPMATHPAALTFTAVVAGADGTSIEASRVRAMAAPATGTPPPGGGGTTPPPGGGGTTPPPDGGGTTPPTTPDTEEPPVPVLVLTDIAGNRHEAAILRMVTAGVIRGYDDGTYRPARSVSRGQMASLLARALGLDIVPCEQGCDDPSDIAGTAHEDAIRALIDAGVAEGFSDGTFRPNQSVSRDQMATFLAKAFGLELDDAEHPFTDVRAGSTHETAIAAIRRAGITLGVTETTFRPRDDVQRDQMASFLDRALGTDEEDADTE